MNPFLFDDEENQELPDDAMQDLPSEREMARQQNLMQQFHDLREQQSSDIDQEIDDNADDLSSDMEMPEQEAPAPQAIPNMSMPQSAAIPTEPGDFQKLLTQRQEQLRNLALIRASQQIGQAFVGGHTGNFKTDSSGVAALEKMANQPVEDYGLRQKAEKGDIGLKDDRGLRDPKSAVSQFYRGIAQQRGLPVSDDLSAFDISQMIKMQGRPSGRGQQIVRVFNKESGEVELHSFDPVTGQTMPLNAVAGFAGQVRQDPRTGELINVQPGTGAKTGQITGPSAEKPPTKETPVALDKSYLTTKQNEALDTTREKFMSETQTTRESMQAADNINALIKYGKVAGADMIRAIQNQIARANGEKGAMSQADVEGFGGEQSIAGALQRWGTMKSFGELPDSDRKILIGLGNVMKQRAKEYYDKQTNFYSNNMYKDLKSSPNLKGINFSPDSVRNLIGSQEFVNDQMVRVISKKTGKPGKMPASKVEEARKKGVIE